MNVAAIALLKDLKRARKIIRKSGAPPLRKMKSPAKGSPHQKTLVRMSGLGDVNPEVLIREAEVACRFLKSAQRAFLSKEWHRSIEDYFKAAAVATNVIFSSKIHGLKLPEQVISDMNCVISEGTLGIKLVMKAVATRGLMHHEAKLHKGQKAEAAVFMKRLVRGKVR